MNISIKKRGGNVDFLKRAWAEINLDALAENLQTIRRTTQKSAKIMAVVKADAYGHGVKYCAAKLQAAGADWFGVSNMEEAIQLRGHHISNPVLILGYTPATQAAELARSGFAQTVFDLSYAQELSQEAVKAGVTVRAHIKIDTGMGRLGFLCYDQTAMADAVAEIAQVCALPGLVCEGFCTHFACADEMNNDFTESQFQRFVCTRQMLADKGITFTLHHCCNSAALMRYPHMHLDMVRPGIILYGLPPSPGMKDLLPLHACMQFKTVISMLKRVNKGTGLSYGHAYHMPDDGLVATVPIGYADGYIRTLSGKADMLVRGVRAPVVGRICMDQLLLDVTNVPGVCEGDAVTVFGQDGDQTITLDELAAQVGSINYESACLVGKRVPRIYLQNGQQIGKQGLI